MTTQSNPQQARQKVQNWWNNLPADQKKPHQDSFQNKNAPTDEELSAAYQRSGQGEKSAS